MRALQHIGVWTGLLGLTWTEPALATNRYVNVSNATPAAPFTTWASAATNIQAAIDEAVSGDEIQVAPGFYPTTDYLYIPEDKILTLRSMERRAAVLDAQGLTSVIMVAGTNSLVEGFTIQHGHPAGGMGGGVFMKNNSVLRDCLVVSNHAYWGGGVLLLPPASVENCSIQYNLADQDGGGVYFHSETGGIVRNCTILNNVASNNGGGVEGNLPGLITDCWIASNQAVTGGGGGVDLRAGAGLVNSVLVSNWAPRGGGVFSFGETTNPAYVVNCTLLMNTATNMGGGVYAGFASRIANNIIFYNTAPISPNLGAEIGTCTITNNCMPEFWGGTNFTNAPAFVDFVQQDFHLATASYCIDSGLAALAPADDYDGKLRPQVGTPGGAALPDVGAFEYSFHFNDIQFIATNVFDLVWDEQHAGIYALDISVPGLVNPSWTNLTAFTNTETAEGHYTVRTLQITYSPIPPHAAFRLRISHTAAK